MGSMARLAHHCSAGSSPVRIGFASDRAVITRAARPDAVGGDRCCPDRSGVGVTAEQTATVDARIAPSLGAVSWNHCKPCWRRRSMRPTPTVPNNKPLLLRRNGLCGWAAAVSMA